MYVHIKIDTLIEKVLQYNVKNSYNSCVNGRGGNYWKGYAVELLMLLLHVFSLNSLWLRCESQLILK